MLTSAVVVSPNVGNMAFASVEATVNGGLQYGFNDSSATVGYRRWYNIRYSYFTNALYKYTAIGGYFKWKWHHMIGVAPAIVGAVDSVCIDVGGVAATIGNITGVSAWSEGDISTAVGDGRQGGGVGIRETVDGCIRIGSRGEGTWVECVGVGPDGVVTSTVSISVAEDNRTSSVTVYISGTIHKGGSDVVAADVGNGARCGSSDIHQTGHGGVTVDRHIGNDVRQGDMEGEGPGCVNSSAIGIGVYKGFSSFAI